MIVSFQEEVIEKGLMKRLMRVSLRNLRFEKVVKGLLKTRFSRSCCTRKARDMEATLLQGFRFFLSDKQKTGERVLLYACRFNLNPEKF